MTYAPTNYLYILATIAFTVYGQLIMKWRMNTLGGLPDGAADKARAVLGLLFDPYIFSAYVAAFLASLAWLVAMSKFPLSHAYPFMSLNFVIVLVFSIWLLSEPVSLQRMLGFLLIVAGTIVAARG